MTDGKNEAARALVALRRRATFACAECGTEFTALASVRRGTSGRRFCCKDHRTIWHNRQKREAARQAKEAGGDAD